jgi:hypothetical protein
MEYTTPNLGVYSNLYTALGLTPGVSLLITNKGLHPVHIAQGVTAPTTGDGYPIQPGDTAIVQGHDGQVIWVLGGISPMYVQALINTIMPFRAVDLPHHVYTSDEERFRRLRVDQGNTGFFEGREFRTFKEFSIDPASTYVLRADWVVNAILHELTTVVDDGHVRISSAVLGTAGGVFGEALPVINKNGMTSKPAPVYLPQNSWVGGGTHTGGTELDVARVLAAVGAGSRTSVGGVLNSERGIAPGTYYIRLTNLGATTATGVLSAWWEELPIPSF